MTPKERYYWDLTGHLVVKGVLTATQVKAANDAIDYLADRCANGTDAESDFLRESAQPRWNGDTLTRTRNNVPFLLQLAKPLVSDTTPVSRKTIAPPMLVTDLRSVEREHIRQVLEETRWVVTGDSGAATRLGVPPSTLRSKMKKLGIVRPN